MQCAISDIDALRQPSKLFEHFVGTQKERFRYRQAKCFRGLEIDDELKLRWILYRQVGRLRASQYAVHVSRPLLKLAYRIEAIRNQSTRFRIKSQCIESRQAQAVASGQ